MQFWVQDIKPKWLPEDFQVPSEMTTQVNQLLQQAENAYYHVDLERNGFLRRREFKKAMKKLGVNKFEAKHMLILVDQERLKVVSIKNYVNAYLFIKCGGLNHINIDYQGPITTGVDKRDHLHDIESKLVTIDFQTFSNHYSSAKVTPSFITQNLFQAIPRGPRGIEVWLLINLKASNGMYLCSENGKVVANRPVASIWEQFYFLNQSDWGNGFLRVLRTYWNTYLTCEMNNTVNDNRTAMGPWEKFDTVSGAGSGFAFKSWTGYYLSADASGNVSFASSLGPNETWQMTILAVSP